MIEIKVAGEPSPEELARARAGAIARARVEVDGGFLVRADIAASNATAMYFAAAVSALAVLAVIGLESVRQRPESGWVAIFAVLQIFPTAMVLGGMLRQHMQAAARELRIGDIEGTKPEVQAETLGRRAKFVLEKWGPAERFARGLFFINCGVFAVQATGMALTQEWPLLVFALVTSAMAALMGTVWRSASVVASALRRILPEERRTKERLAADAKKKEQEVRTKV